MDLQQRQSDIELARAGKALITRLFVLIKTAQNYDEGHSAIDQPATNIVKTVQDIYSRGEEAHIKAQKGYLLLGETRLKPDATGFDAFMFTMGEMKRYYIGGINFSSSIKKEEVIALAYTFKEVDPIPSPQTFDKFVEVMNRRGIKEIEVEVFSEEEAKFERMDGEGEMDNKARAKKVYLQTIHAVSDVMEDAKLGQTLKMTKSKRVVQGLVDQMLAAETNLVGLTTIRCHDEYTYHHSVNVCILSIGIGQRVGLNKPMLCELGMAALFHDIGKSDVPLEILNKPAEFTKEEWEVMQRHPIYGVKKLLKLKGLDVLTARIVTGAFEHHLNYDLSGYPKVPYKEVSLFGRIISIADCYDGLTSSRVYSRSPHSPDKALKFMMSRAGKAYDPVLMKLFTNCIGVYPIGTLLRLSSNELAVVMENNSNSEKWNSPKVKIIADSSGSEVDGEVVEASEGRSILETLDAQQYKIDVTRYFL